MLLCWDTSVTDNLKSLAKKKAKDAEKEQQVRVKAQKDELDEAVNEAQRRLQIAKSEVGKKKKLSQYLRAQKVNLVEQGAGDRVAEVEKLLLKAEMEWGEAEKFMQDLDWKLKRVQLKRTDWENAQTRQQQKKDGKLQGFKVQVVVESNEQFNEVKELLSLDLELKKEYTTKDDMILVKGDVLLKEELLAAVRDKKDLSTLEIEDDAWPINLWFNHGFNMTIQIKEVSDVLIKDVSGARKKDGRWPLVIDPSGKTSTFMSYSGAAIFNAVELMASLNDKEFMLRFRKALLKGLLYGAQLVIDLQGFGFPIDTLEEVFNTLEKGLWNKLTDRAVLYSYLLPRRFMRLVHGSANATELEKEGFHEGCFLDDYIQNFVLSFLTTIKEPDLDFAKLFYVIRVKDPAAEEEASA